MTSLFPGMLVEEVLSSQVAHLARLQLDRVLESRLQAGIPQGIVGQVPGAGIPGRGWEMARRQDSCPTASSGGSPAPRGWWPESRGRGVPLTQSSGALAWQAAQGAGTRAPEGAGPAALVEAGTASG